MKRRSRGPRKDWVFRGYEYDADTGAVLAAQVASFTGVDRNSGTYTLTTGTPGGVILVNSMDYLTQGTRNIIGGGATMMGREARPEGRKVHIYAATCELFLQPTTWTAGTDFAVGIRLVICDQNQDSGAMDLPANYTILGASAPQAINTEPSLWANGWGNLRERIMRQAFATENDMARFTMRLAWKGKRTLQPHLCLGLFIENAGPSIGSTSLRYSVRCKTLVSA